MNRNRRTISIQNLLARVPGIEEVRAHCDIPCRIYDTGPALIAAVSVVRMMDIIHEVVAKTDADPLSKHNTIAQHRSKEKEAEKDAAWRPRSMMATLCC